MTPMNVMNVALNCGFSERQSYRECNVLVCNDNRTVHSHCTRLAVADSLQKTIDASKFRSGNSHNSLRDG